MKAARHADRKSYETKLAALQRDLVRLQQAYFQQGRRAILVFEGWDAAGKGGTIRRLTERLDPRGVHVWPIGAPTAAEQGRPKAKRRRAPSVSLTSRVGAATTMIR